jgi:hypothetical protein
MSSALQPNHPKQKLLFFVAQDVDEEVRGNIRDFVLRLTGKRRWLIPATLSMNKLIIQMADFVATGQIGELLVSAQSAMGTRDLGVIAVKILTWLKVEAKNKSRQPLQLNLEYSWCKNLVRLVQLDLGFSQIFLVEDNELRFTNNIDPIERSNIQDYANEHYKPRLMTKTP